MPVTLSNTGRPRPRPIEDAPDPSISSFKTYPVARRGRGFGVALAGGDVTTIGPGQGQGSPPRTPGLPLPAQWFAVGSMDPEIRRRQNHGAHQRDGVAPPVHGRSADYHRAAIRIARQPSGRRSHLAHPTRAGRRSHQCPAGCWRSINGSTGRPRPRRRYALCFAGTDHQTRGQLWPQYPAKQHFVELSHHAGAARDGAIGHFQPSHRPRPGRPGCTP